MNSEFWKGKRVFITGHTGFKGGWLSLWLQEMGAIVKGYALQPPTSPCLYEEAKVWTGMSSESGDVRDFAHLRQAIHEFEPEIVFHMAAQPLVRPSYEDPIETYSTNVMGTVYLLEAVRQVGGVKAVVNVTSDKCYENKEWVWGYRENEPMGGFDPYSNSKGCSELVTSSYRDSFFSKSEFDKHSCALASARAGNVIGGGDWAADRLVPDILYAFNAGKDLEIRNPNAIRPWQHVLEPLSGYLMLAERLYLNGAEFAESWNFGPREEGAKPVSWIVDKLASYYSGQTKWFVSQNVHPHEANYLKLDCSKAKMKLGWSPKLDLDEALYLAFEWSSHYVNGEDMRSISRKQINYFQEKYTNE